MKVGDVFFTAAGRVAKVVNEFAFGDGFKFNVAVWDGARWVATRLNEFGQSAESTTYNFQTELDNWKDFYAFTVSYNRAEKFWTGTASHGYISTLNSAATRCKSPEEVLKVLKTSSHEKILESLKPLGYTVVTEDVEGDV